MLRVFPGKLKYFTLLPANEALVSSENQEIDQQAETSQRRNIYENNNKRNIFFCHPVFTHVCLYLASLFTLIYLLPTLFT